MALSQSTADGSQGGARRTLLACLGGLALAVVLWGGYSHHWPWTGINGGTATLWDWLHLLLLPLAVAVFPVWLRRDTRVHPRSKLYTATALAAFAVVVILGYVVPWGWTGFRGNTLWDWFNLVFLPLTVVLMPRFLELREGWRARHTALTACLLTLFLAAVLGGYLGSWTWTGFTGNTLWNWMNLLFLPLLLPTVILPALMPIAMARVVYLDEHGNPIDGFVVEAERSPAASEAASPTGAPPPAIPRPADDPPTLAKPPTQV